MNLVDNYNNFKETQKITDFRFDSQTVNRLLSPWERYFTQIFHWRQAVYRLWWHSPVKDLQTESKEGSLV